MDVFNVEVVFGGDEGAALGVEVCVQGVIAWHDMLPIMKGEAVVRATSRLLQRVNGVGCTTHLTAIARIFSMHRIDGALTGVWQWCPATSNLLMLALTWMRTGPGTMLAEVSSVLEATRLIFASM